MGKWNNIKEKQPKEGQMVIALLNYPEGSYEDNIGSWKYTKELPIPSLKYWQSLPEPPKDIKP